MEVRAASPTTKERICQLLDELPPDKLRSVEDFVAFLREQGPLLRLAQYPTVENPASSLGAWLDLIPGGCGGDALADSEALYDEV